LPYIGQYFKKEYIIPNYVGESLSSMIPSILGILQGVGIETECNNLYNKTDEYLNGTKNFNQSFLLTHAPLKPAFSVSTFFFIMFLILLISTISFTLLNYAPVSIRTRNDKKTNENGDKNILTPKTTSDYERVSFHYTSLSSLMEQKTGQIELIKNTDESDNTIETSKINSKEKVLLLIIGMFVSFTIYGILPAFQSYSTLV
jgi:hypothetical protein